MWQSCLCAVGMVRQFCLVAVAILCKCVGIGCVFFSTLEITVGHLQELLLALIIWGVCMRAALFLICCYHLDYY